MAIVHPMEGQYYKLGTASDLKESNPIEAAKYAVARGIKDEPAFASWVNFTLKKTEHIISAVKKSG
jgi:hypothetical protein